MAYADPLDETQPAGNTKVKLGDDAIRTAIRAIRQRLSSIMVNIDADPMVLKDGTIKTSNIIDANVTQAKLAKPAVGTPELVDRSVTGAKIALDTILSENVGAGQFDFDTVNTALGFMVAGGAALGYLLKGDGTRFVPALLALADFPDAVLQKLLIAHSGWFVDNVPGSSTSFMERFRSGGGLDQHVVVMPQAGEIREVWVRGNADKVAGNVQFSVTKNGVVTGAFAQIGDAPYGVREDYRLYGPGAQVFAAGDYLGMSWVSVGLVPAGTTEYIAGFGVRYT